MKATKFLLFTSMIVFLTTCTERSMDPNICFTENVLPIFVSKCSMSGCHDPGSRRGDLSTYESIMKKVTPKHPMQSDVYTKIYGANPSMPPKGSTQLTDQEKFNIKAWISMGALNQSNCTVCDTALFKFTECATHYYNLVCWLS